MLSRKADHPESFRGRFEGRGWSSNTRKSEVEGVDLPVVGASEFLEGACPQHPNRSSAKTVWTLTTYQHPPSAKNPT